VVVNRDLKQSLLHQVRWMKSTRFSRPKGHFGTVLTFAMPFGLVGFFAALAGGKPWLAAGILAVAILNRLVLSIAAGWFVVRDPNAVNFCWLYPLRDLMGFFFWAASYGSSEIVWRNQRYRLHYGGKMTPIPSVKEESRPVNVDHLA